jgi:hypothetical protein
MTYNEFAAVEKAIRVAVDNARAAVVTLAAGANGSEAAYLSAKRKRATLETQQIEHEKNRPQLRVTNPAGKAIVGPFSALEAVLLRINGGGNFEREVVQAMQDGEAVRDGHTVRHAGWIVESVPASPFVPAPLRSPVAITVGATS